MPPGTANPIARKAEPVGNDARMASSALLVLTSGPDVTLDTECLSGARRRRNVLNSSAALSDSSMLSARLLTSPLNLRYAAREAVPRQ